MNVYTARLNNIVTHSTLNTVPTNFATTLNTEGTFFSGDSTRKVGGSNPRNCILNIHVVQNILKISVQNDVHCGHKQIQ